MLRPSLLSKVEQQNYVPELVFELQTHQGHERVKLKGLVQTIEDIQGVPKNS